MHQEFAIAEENETMTCSVLGEGGFLKPRVERRSEPSRSCLERIGRFTDSVAELISIEEEVMNFWKMSNTR